MFHMFRPGLAAKSLVIDAFVTIHLDLWLCYTHAIFTMFLNDLHCFVHLE